MSIGRVMDGCWCGNCGSIHPDEIDAVAEIKRLREALEDIATVHPKSWTTRRAEAALTTAKRGET
jgi:hypothetical protein